MPLTDEQWEKVTDGELLEEFKQRDLDVKIREECARDAAAEVQDEANSLMRAYREEHGALWESLYNKVRGTDVPEPLRELIYIYFERIV